MTDQQATAPAYMSPIPADHPLRHHFGPEWFDTDPALLGDRELVDALYHLRFERGLCALQSWEDAEKDQASRLTSRLHDEIMRRLSDKAVEA